MQSKPKLDANHYPAAKIIPQVFRQYLDLKAPWVEDHPQNNSNTNKNPPIFAQLLYIAVLIDLKESFLMWNVLLRFNIVYSV